MFIRNWINIILLIYLAYCARQVMTGYAGQLSGWQYYLYQLSPWVLLYGSLRGWYRCFTWRRMTSGKNISPDLSRGQHRPSRQKQRPSILEFTCLALALISVAAILKQFGNTWIIW